MKPVLTAALVAAIAAAAVPVSAHHGVNAQYDTSKYITMTGTLVKIDWINPHAYFHYDVPAAGGKVQRWIFESPGPNAMRRAGLSSRNLFKVGDKYTIRSNPSRDGSHMGTFGIVKFPDGRTINIEAADPAAKK
ncbi:MAG TPA: DUF6152 family protein [Sphingomicrobium sp.]|jgi:hypothetical protein